MKKFLYMTSFVLVLLHATNLTTIVNLFSAFQRFVAISRSH